MSWPGCCCAIVPPYILDRLAEAGHAELQASTIEAVSSSSAARAVRAMVASYPALAATPSLTGDAPRLVYDAEHRWLESLPGRLVRDEWEDPGPDDSVNRAYDGAGQALAFYRTIFHRSSYNGRGAIVRSSVHVGRRLINAWWTGTQLAYGDGDDRRFGDFTRSLDVIGHEFTHGVIMHTSNLRYQGESGAIHESCADIFGVLIRQWAEGRAVDEDDWTIGAAVIGPELTARAIRTLTEEPAYRHDPVLGDDPQPKHRRDAVTTTSDYGGVHLNSGIPNHAFYLTAKALGGHAWTRAGRIWYQAMITLKAESGFDDLVEQTIAAATQLEGSQSLAVQAVTKAWRAVGW